MYVIENWIKYIHLRNLSELFHGLIQMFYTSVFLARAHLRHSFSLTHLENYNMGFKRRGEREGLMYYAASESSPRRCGEAVVICHIGLFTHTTASAEMNVINQESEGGCRALYGRRAELRLCWRWKFSAWSGCVKIHPIWDKCWKISSYNCQCGLYVHYKEWVKAPEVHIDWVGAWIRV